jgi:hypothetical protein
VLDRVFLAQMLAALFAASTSELSTDPRRWSVADAAAWVRSLGFAEHAGAFSEAGVDGKRLLGLTAEALEAELLLPVAEHRLALEMEIGELKLRRGLFSRADKKAHLAAYPRAAEWSAADVAAFLAQQGLGAHAAAGFAGVDGRALLALSADALRARVAAAGEPREQAAASAELLEAALEALRRRDAPGKVRKDEL